MLDFPCTGYLLHPLVFFGILGRNFVNVREPYPFYYNKSLVNTRTMSMRIFTPALAVVLATFSSVGFLGI